MNVAVVGAVIAVLVLLVIYFVYQKISGLQGQVSRLAVNLEQIKTVLVDNEEVELIARKIFDKGGKPVPAAATQKVERPPPQSRPVQLPQNPGSRVPPAQPKINAVTQKPAGGPGVRDIPPNTVEKKIQNPQIKEEDAEPAAPPPKNSRSDIEPRKTPPPSSAADLDAVFGEEVKIVLEMAHKQFGGLQLDTANQDSDFVLNDAVRCADNAPEDTDDAETDPRTRATFSTMFFDVQSIADSLFSAGGAGGSGSFGGAGGSGVVIREIND